MRSRSGQRAMTRIAPTMISLPTPLTKLKSPDGPKIRFAPARGEIFFSEGLMRSAVKTGRDWIVFERIAAATTHTAMRPSAIAAAIAIWMNRCCSAPGSIAIKWGELKNVAPASAMVRAAGPDRNHKISVPAPSIPAAITSWLFGASPLRRASNRRFCVGSSVR